MGTIIGRDAELRQIGRFLEQARTQRVARVLRITGRSGNGKTSLALAAQAEAQNAGWVSPFVAAHRIQTTLPFVVARRAAEQLTQELGPQGATYVSGLEAALRDPSDAKGFDAAFSRFIEAVLLDHPLALIIDDAQWSDRDSGALLLRTMQLVADRPFVLVIVDRSEENAEPAFDYIDETIVVREFPLPIARELARHLMPQAADAVIDAVAHHTQGRAIDIATIASLSTGHEHLTEDAVAASARAIIASSLSHLKAATREFLQICSLIGDPIGIDILNALWSSETVLEFIRECSGRYLVQDHEGLRIVHLTVSQSIRETIPIEIPYRKRIIAAIESLPSISLEQRERLVDQAAAVGERDLERRYLEALVAQAEIERALPLVASALERLIALTPFGPEALNLYTRLSIIYNVVSLDGSIRVSRDALDRAAAAGIREGLGQLAASLLFALLHHSDREEYRRTLARYDELLTSPSDRAHLLGVQLYAAYCDANLPEFEHILDDARKRGIADPVFELRAATFEGLLRARLAIIEDFPKYPARARSVIARHGLPPIFHHMIAVSETIHTFYRTGLATATLDGALLQVPEGTQERENLEILRLIGRGAHADAIDRIVDRLTSPLTTFNRLMLFGLLACIVTCTHFDLPPNLEGAFGREVQRALAGGHAPATLPLLAGALGRERSRDRAKEIAERVMMLASRPFELQIIWLPIVLARAAERAQDISTLKGIAAGSMRPDPFPWTIAQHRLAVISAKAALGEDVDVHERDEVTRSLSTLGAPWFAELAHDGTAAKRTPPQPEERLSILSRREREVARLIAEGSTNREIAHSLVLSERTVEGHVANIFNKLDVGARSQVAVWYVANAPAPDRS